MDNLETKKLPIINFKALNDDAGTFEGYLAVFGNIDLNGDVIDKGAFTRSLGIAKALQKQNKSPFLYPLLWQHDMDEPIGGITDAKEDDYGLYIKGQYDLNTELGARAYSGAKMGYLPGLSIGFRTIKSIYSNIDQARHLTELQLFEGSVVTLPANTSAMVTSVKNRDFSRTPDGDSSDELKQELVYQAAVMVLESKAGSIRHEIGDKELARQTKEFQARAQAELLAIHERHALERKARARGERVPSLHADPEAYVVWLQRQRQLPYVQLARSLDQQSRQCRGGQR